MVAVRSFVADAERNASVGWVAVVAIAGLAVGQLVFGDPLWSAFATVVAGVLALPAAVTGDWTTLVPWPLAAAPALAFSSRLVGRFPEVAGYVAVAALAIVIVVELDEFTAVEMSRRFAVAFAVATTMAVQAVWTVAQFVADGWLGTSLLRGQRELQWDLVHVTLVGLAFGAVGIWLLMVVPDRRELNPERAGGES